MGNLNFFENENAPPHFLMEQPLPLIALEKSWEKNRGKVMKKNLYCSQNEYF